jgi:hypothetical protein
MLAAARIAGAVLATTTVLAGPATVSSASAPGFGSRITFGHSPHRFAGGNWGGYVSTGGFTTARASWVMPSVTCTSSSDLFAPWVGLDGSGSSTVEQTGVAVDCADGTPAYKPWIEMYPAAPEYFTERVAAGDLVTGVVAYQGSGVYSLTLSDSTAGWSQTFSRTASAKNLTAEAIIESPTDAYPSMSEVRFTEVTFDGKDLAATSPSALSADDRGSAVWQPGEIGADQRSFSLTRS